jgi:putative ABC transport system permease protein
MNKWLQSFAFKIEMSLYIFLFAGFLTLFIALLTVGSQAVKAAITNPADSLRYE